MTFGVGVVVGVTLGLLVGMALGVLAVVWMVEDAMVR